MCTLQFGPGFRHTPDPAQTQAVPVMRCGIARVERDGALELLLGTHPVPLVEKFDGAQGGMCLSERFINLKRFQCRRFCLGHPFPRAQHVGRVCQREVRIRQPGVGPRITRVFGQSLLEKVGAPSQTLRRALVPLVASPQVCLVCFGVYLPRAN